LDFDGLGVSASKRYRVLPALSVTSGPSSELESTASTPAVFRAVVAPELEGLAATDPAAGCTTVVVGWVLAPQAVARSMVAATPASRTVRHFPIIGSSRFVSAPACSTGTWP
jgi:hypothetical protein